jgi:hypothetical protein
MTPYLDAGFLITLLVRTDGTAIARKILRDTRSSCLLTVLHELQARTFLTMNERSAEPDRKRAARSGMTLWRWFSAEGFLVSVDVDWALAFRAALNYIEESRDAPPAPLLILHPLIAIQSGATDFLSFDPRSRIIAKRLGLKVLPERL